MEAQKINTVAVLAIALTGITVSVLAASLLMAYQRVPNYGSVKSVGVGVYEDEECTRNVTEIDWGFLIPGSSFTREVWIKNTGNVEIVLNMTTEGWSPAEVRNYLTLTWDYEGQVLNASQVVRAVFTLSVSETITETDIESFSFDIVITGIEHLA